jgi:hypothetical protein
MTEQDYADNKGDGKCDVVVTRWPISSNADIVALASKMKKHSSTPRWRGRSVISSADDKDSAAGGSGAGAQVANWASSIESWLFDIDNDLTISQFRTSWFSGPTLGEDRHDSIAALLNEVQPELLNMLAVYSTPLITCNVFGNGGWEMSSLDTCLTIPLINAASCLGGGHF